jgi:hypothetical protein
MFSLKFCKTCGDELDNVKSIYCPVCIKQRQKESQQKWKEFHWNDYLEKNKKKKTRDIHSYTVSSTYTIVSDPDEQGGFLVGALLDRDSVNQMLKLSNFTLDTVLKRKNELQKVIQGKEHQELISLEVLPS